MTELSALYQEMIMDHGRHPRNFGALPDANYHKEGFNPLCGDKIILHAKKHQGVLQKIQFEGTGCAISIASASLLTEMLTGKTLLEYEELFKQFHTLVTTGASGDQLGKLAVLGGVYAFPARVKCATLAWHTLKALVLTLTDAAVTHIQKMLNDQPNSIGFRLSIKKTGCSGYAYVPKLIEKAQPTDIHFMAQDHLNVYIDLDALPLVQGLIIDYVTDDHSGIQQKRLVFINPNESNRCGCGESFTIE